MGSFGMKKDVRNAYLRYVINMLRNKYHVNLAGLAKACGFYPVNLNDFSRGTRNFATRNLDKLESFVSDLYGGIIEDEIPQDEKMFKMFLDNL